MNREKLEEAYLKLGNLLEQEHSNLQFKNHCYWRIANDYTCFGKWDTYIEGPFYKKANDLILRTSVNTLKSMLFDEDRINNLNQISLNYRKRTTADDLEYIKQLSNEKD